MRICQHIVQKCLGNQGHAEIDKAQAKADAKNKPKRVPVLQDTGKQRTPDAFRFAVPDKVLAGTEHQCNACETFLELRPRYGPVTYSRIIQENLARLCIHPLKDDKMIKIPMNDKRRYQFFQFLRLIGKSLRFHAEGFRRRHHIRRVGTVTADAAKFPQLFQRHVLFIIAEDDAKRRCTALCCFHLEHHRGFFTFLHRLIRP